MFIVTMIFLAGMISAVQILLLAYSTMDASETLSNNDLYLLNNLKDVTNQTLTSAENCEEFKTRLKELKTFLADTYGSFEYVTDIDFSVNCDNWNNTPPEDAPVTVSLEIKSGSGGYQTVTREYYRVYRNVGIM